LQNTCSGRREPRRKRGWGTNAYHLLLALVLLCCGCLPDPQRTQMTRLWTQLVDARMALSEEPPRAAEACDTVGDVVVRLWGEPGLVDVRPAWPAMRAAADALWAVCGQMRLLQQPFESTAAMLEARERWQRGVTTELATACRYLDEAAAALGQLATSVGCAAS
jgi:hypothetical protein